MRPFQINEEVWWFDCQSTTGNVYPKWLNLFNGKVIWMSPDEEIMHIHIEGSRTLREVLEDEKFVYRSKEQAIDAIISRITEIKHE